MYKHLCCVKAQGEKFVVLAAPEGIELEGLADQASNLLLPSYLV